MDNFKIPIIKGKSLEVLNKILKSKKTVFWHKLTRTEKYHSNRLIAFGLIKKNTHKISNETFKKTIFSLTKVCNAEYIADDETMTV